MKINIAKSCLLAVALTVITSSTKADLTLGVDFTGGWIPSGQSYGVGNFAYTLGYDFQVTSPVTVVALAALDTYTSSGLPQAVPVGLWNSTGTLLTSATIAQGTLPTLGAINLFAQVGITPITLQPGDYTVAAHDEWVQGEGGYHLTDFTTAPGIDYTGYAQTDAINAFAYPELQGPRAPGDEALFGGNIVLGPTPTPEPGQTAAGGLLLVCGALFFSSRRWLARRAVAGARE